MKKYKIKDSLGKEKIVQAESAVDAIKKTKTHIKDSVVIGTNGDGTEFTYKNGAFYADGIKLEHDLVKDALVNDETLSNEQKQWFLKHKQELIRVANIILNTMQVLEVFDTQHAMHAKELAKDILNVAKEIK